MTSNKFQALPPRPFLYSRRSAGFTREGQNSFATLRPSTGDSRNKTRPAKVVVVANSKQKVFSWTQLVVKYTSKNFGYDYTLYWVEVFP